METPADWKMNNLDQCYRLLGLEPGASLEEVNQAYKDLAFIWHPDRIPEDNHRLRQKAQEKLKEINQARDQLRSLGTTTPTPRGKTTPTPRRKAQPSPQSARTRTYYQPKRAYYQPRTQTHYQPRTPHPDLSGADFQGADLKEKDLSGRNLSNANLSKANLSDAFCIR